MNIGATTCAIMGVIFFLVGIVFAMLGERGAMLISGFNTMPKEQREQYDKRKMSEDMRNILFIWTILFVAGGILSYFVSTYIVIPVMIIWLVLFFREVHLDAEKAIEKYKL